MTGVSLVKPGAAGRYGLAILGENVNQVFAFQAEIVIVSILKVRGYHRGEFTRGGVTIQPPLIIVSSICGVSY